MSLRKEDQLFTIEYPESDGEPMAETDVHYRLMTDLRFELEQFFRDDEDVYVSGNILLYYVEGNPKKRVAPDVLVARGVRRGERRVYKLWEEGRAPDVVFEVSSRQTWREDLNTKWRLYEDLGVKEYFIFDPEYDYLVEPLIAWRLESGRYEAVEVVEGAVKSEVLDLELVNTGETLRLRNLVTGQFLLTPSELAEEADRLRREVEQLRGKS
ncbi:MAG: Uma2 family endonuclease [Acidobacteriota bacterium]